MSRLYLVKEKKGEKSWLIEANNQAQAMRFVTGALYGISPASAKETAELMAAGKKVYNATKAIPTVKEAEQPEPSEQPGV